MTYTLVSSIPTSWAKPPCDASAGLIAWSRTALHLLGELAGEIEIEPGEWVWRVRVLDDQSAGCAVRRHIEGGAGHPLDRVRRHDHGELVVIALLIDDVVVVGLGHGHQVERVHEVGHVRTRDAHPKRGSTWIVFTGPYLQHRCHRRLRDGQRCRWIASGGRRVGPSLSGLVGGRVGCGHMCCSRCKDRSFQDKDTDVRPWCGKRTRQASVVNRQQPGETVAVASTRTRNADPPSAAETDWPLRAILVGGVAIRVIAALLLVAGPWTNEVAELAGWDVARFQEIADAPGQPWVDHEVEYPPGSVLAIETIAQDGVVQTHRILVALALAIDLGIALLLALSSGRRAAGAYLLLGLPLIPAGLLRFDLLSVALALIASIALGGLVKRKADDAGEGATETRPGAFAAIVAAAALVKVWPALLVAGAFALGRRTAAVSAVAAMAISGIAWLAYAGLSLDPIEQVVSLRGATGWHVESLGGTITALTSDAEPERQLNAFRIGELNQTLVTAGRVLTVAIVVGLGWLVHRRGRTRPDLQLLALFMLGSVAALLVTAPLLSPQFLLWLTPWAAIVAAGAVTGDRWAGISVALTAAATLMTGAVLAYYGPPNVAEPTPAALLLARNVALAALVPAVALALLQPTAQRQAPAVRLGGPTENEPE